MGVESGAWWWKRLMSEGLCWVRLAEAEAERAVDGWGVEVRRVVDV